MSCKQEKIVSRLYGNLSSLFFLFGDGLVGKLHLTVAVLV